MSNNVVVIGGGASGLFAAGVAVDCGACVTIVERNSVPARKVLITGKGRCNVTNNCDDISKLISNVPTNGRFLYSAFSKFMPADTISFFEGKGIPLKTERGNRVFPVSDKASDIASALTDYSLSRAKFVQGRAVKFLSANSTITGIQLESGEVITGDAFILATGGASYKATGSTGDGYKLSKDLGHTITDIRPSLVALVSKDDICSRLQGLSLKNVKLTLECNGKNLYSELGELLFTHFGLSGPLVLSASAHLNSKTVKKSIISIDIKPGLSEKQLDDRILRDFSNSPNKNISNVISSLMPSKLVEPILEISGINKYSKVNTITRQQRLNLVYTLKNFKVNIADFYQLNSAIITSGGVSVKEIDPKSMKSKLINNLFFCGEIIDVDAYTGGFNLQIAFSTAKVAGESAANY